MSKARQAFGFRAIVCLAAILGCVVVRQARPQSADCRVGPAAAALTNANSLDLLPWSPFGRLEIGWRTYAVMAAREIGSACAPNTPGFAARLASWQGAHHLPGEGTMTVTTLGRMRDLWRSRRPFVAISRQACPDPPPISSLVQASASESFGGKIILLRPRALAAYRAMVAAARSQSRAIAADRRLLTVFSAFRSPAYDAARCAAQHNCQGITRASCSAHRTALAVDLYLGSAPGFPPDSANDVNRQFLAQSAAYRWLVANAGRYGWVNYPFEPWHWEWTGERP